MNTLYHHSVMLPRTSDIEAKQHMRTREFRRWLQKASRVIKARDKKHDAWWQASVELAGQAIANQEAPLFTDGDRLRVRLQYWPPDNRRRDPDNYRKAIFDVLAEAGV
ncbi:MAG: hypothetical protein V2J89_17110, partial [Halieaceae bacterium]|nr:hypothetical protein [Halieaceae bacterium]